MSNASNARHARKKTKTAVSVVLGIISMTLEALSLALLPSRNSFGKPEQVRVPTMPNVRATTLKKNRGNGTSSCVNVHVKRTKTCVSVNVKKTK